MFEIEINRQISAAHRLCGYPGDCAKLHGHNWQITAILQVKELDELGIAVDFKYLKKILDELITPLDHAYLNDLDEFREKNPTSERLAQYIFHALVDRLNNNNVKVARIRVSESPSSVATYYED